MLCSAYPALAYRCCVSQVTAANVTQHPERYSVNNIAELPSKGPTAGKLRAYVHACVHVRMHMLLIMLACVLVFMLVLRARVCVCVHMHVYACTFFRLRKL